MSNNFADHFLTKAEVQRFSRQLLLKDFGTKGQESLKTAKVLIVGAGGLGCPVSSYLAAAGVGRIGIVDHDEVSLDNLHRQISHTEGRVGVSKVESIKQVVKELNSDVVVDVYSTLINSKNALSIAEPYQIVVDCSDNMATRYLVNDLSVLTKKVLVSGSALGWEGQLTVYNNGPDCPCYRCLFPQPPPPETVTNCSEGGVLGPITGIIGSMMALEVIKICFKGKSSYAGKLFVLDGFDGRMRNVSLRKRNEACLVCGQKPDITSLIDYEEFCGSGANDKVKSLHLLSETERISVRDYHLRHDNDNDDQAVLIDVRPEHEFDICKLKSSKNIPLTILQKLNEEEIKNLIPENCEDVYMLCHRGNDSQLAVKFMENKVEGARVRDIIGGLDAWALEVDTQFPRY